MNNPIIKKFNEIGEKDFDRITIIENVEQLLMEFDLIVKFIGKSKIERGKKLLKKTEQEMSEYEIHLQNLEAQIRDHIRVRQQ